MKFLGDMGVSGGVIRWLTANGHDATHLADQNLQKLSDSLIFAKASTEHRVVLTFDLDFGEILALSGDRIVSVVLFRLNDTTTAFVIERLSKILSDAIGQCVRNGRDHCC
jgi:predicted nuclease of predicted toxin-antitoxin system